ncbi:cytidyltransferase [Saccharopolyspora karakumensis]|uniref:FAD synthase n=1 Tax=Saccharopolyspora karakumensis TaxID=2530386 RepID=A0A4V2YWN5_9PSEU|nr:cytidyltransferase [Saccharopolyspora karakumensis]
MWRGLSDVPADWPSCAVTIGVFDGVHRGHAWLIENTLRAAAETGLPTVLVTFDPHPARVLGLPRDTSALSSVERRAGIARELGVDRVCVLPFTLELARMSPAEFVENVLVNALRAASVVVGANFTFGHRGAGDVDTLRRLGARHGFTTRGVDLMPADGADCSSTHVRGCLQRGDVLAATRALGRPHEVAGVLTNGHEVALSEGTALPRSGRYAGAVSGRAAELVVTRSPGPDSAAARLHCPDALGAPGEAVRIQFLETLGT